MRARRQGFSIWYSIGFVMGLCLSFWQLSSRYRPQLLRSISFSALCASFRQLFVSRTKVSLSFWVCWYRSLWWLNRLLSQFWLMWSMARRCFSMSSSMYKAFIFSCLTQQPWMNASLFSISFSMQSITPFSLAIALRHSCSSFHQMAFFFCRSIRLSSIWSRQYFFIFSFSSFRVFLLRWGGILREGSEKLFLVSWGARGWGRGWEGRGIESESCLRLWSRWRFIMIRWYSESVGATREKFIEDQQFSISIIMRLFACASTPCRRLPPLGTAFPQTHKAALELILQNMDIEQDDPTIQDLRSFQAVESNCQLLTLVRKRIYPETHQHANLLSNFDFKEHRLNYESFIQLLIQSAYLVYSCKYHGLHPNMEPNDVRIQENSEQKRFTIVIYYRFAEAKDFKNHSEIVDSLYAYLLKTFYEAYKATTQAQTHADKEFAASIQNFVSQYTFLSQVFGKMEGEEKERVYFLLLEETSLFREHCLLLKIKNYSMVNFIKSSITWFREFKDCDIASVTEYNNLKSAREFKSKSLKSLEEAIQNNINKFFSQLAAQLNGNTMSESESGMKARWKLVIDPIKEASFIERLAKLDARFASLEFAETSPASKSAPLEYHIEYSSERNSICVKLVMHNIVLNLDASDYILVQSNVMTFDSANVSAEVIEAKQLLDSKTQSSKKMLVLRGASCFNSKEPLLEKILLLMDITMVAAKVYEPELCSPKVGYLAGDSERLGLVSRKIEHYTSLLLKCTKKVYNE